MPKTADCAVVRLEFYLRPGGGGNKTFPFKVIYQTNNVFSDTHRRSDLRSGSELDRLFPDGISNDAIYANVGDCTIDDDRFTRYWGGWG
jgi:hypothetical protein